MTPALFSLASGSLLECQSFTNISNRSSLTKSPPYVPVFPSEDLILFITHWLALWNWAISSLLHWTLPTVLHAITSKSPIFLSIYKNHKLIWLSHLISTQHGLPWYALDLTKPRNFVHQYTFPRYPYGYFHLVSLKCHTKEKSSPWS